MKENLANKLKRQVYGRKLTGYLILGAIAAVFVFFGYGGNSNFMGSGYAIRVNNSLVSSADFQNEVSRIQQYYASLFGGQFDLGSQRNLLNQQAVESLLRNELVYQSAVKEGIYSTDAEVRDYIVSVIPAFQENGVFMRDRYLAYLENTRSTAGDFENKLRKDIANIRTRSLFENAAVTSEYELTKIKELGSKKRSIYFVKLNEDDLINRVKVDANKVQEALADQAVLKKAEEYFVSHKSDWVKPEAVAAQHILVSTKPGVSEADALKKANEILAKSKSEDFGSLAQKHSEDPGSKTKKGELPEFQRGQMVKEFEEAAFAANEGQIVGPVKTQFGYHVIKVNKKVAAKNPSFEDIKSEAVQKVLAREIAQENIKKVDELVSQGDQAAFEQFIKTLNVNWQETGFFDLSAEAIPQLPSGSVSNAAFEVSEAKPFLNRVILDTGSKYVLKFKESKNEAVAAAGETKEMITRRRADGFYTEWIQAQRASAKIEINNQLMRAN